MQVLHTAGVPPIRGRIIFPIIGWTKNNRKALTKSVMINNNGNGPFTEQNPFTSTTPGDLLIGRELKNRIKSPF
ncbi:MAG: hypothetical protein ACREOW_10585 [Thermodesulfobacteriota bacterium]